MEDGINKERKEFLEAILKAKRNFKPIKLDKVNKGFNSKYASLNSIGNGIDEALLDNDLRIQHDLRFDEGCQWLDTILIHINGEQSKKPSSYLLFERVSMPKDHGKASALTYGKRQTTSAMLSLITEEDDDGNAASGVSDKKKPAPKPVAKNAFQLLVEWAKLPDKVVKDELQKHNIKTVKELENFTMDAAKAVINKYKESINE